MPMKTEKIGKLKPEPEVYAFLDIYVRGKVVRKVPLREALEWMAVALEEQGSVKLAADEMERNIRRMLRKV
jgi:hypothetical protein